MNRILKFRAWDKKNKVMASTDIEAVITLDGYFMIPNNGRLINSDDFILMQYTGLKDKNGVEIYEGDILRWQDWEQEGTDSPDIYVVEYVPAAFQVKCFRNGKLLGGQDPFDNLDNEFFEVIGNIYENPELLKP